MGGKEGRGRYERAVEVEEGRGRAHASSMVGLRIEKLYELELIMWYSRGSTRR